MTETENRNRRLIAGTTRRVGKGSALTLAVDEWSARVLWAYLDTCAEAVENGWGDTDAEARTEASACRKGCQRIQAAFPDVAFR